MSHTFIPSSISASEIEKVSPKKEPSIFEKFEKEVLDSLNRQEVIISELEIKIKSFIGAYPETNHPMIEAEPLNGRETLQMISTTICHHEERLEVLKEVLNSVF